MKEMNEKFNTIMPETTDRTLCMMVDRPISADGYRENFLPRVQAILERHGEIRCLIYFKDYKGWEEEAAALNFSDSLKLDQKIKRFAMVNPPPKLIALYTLKRDLIGGETKIFNEGDLEAALEWVNQ